MTDDETAELRRRLEEAEETIRAIQTGAVDALVIGEPDGDRVYTLQGAERPYRLLVEEMQQAALTLYADGAIAYCNRRFAEFVKAPHEKLVGTLLRDFIAEEDWEIYENLLWQGQTRSGRGEARLKGTDDVLRPAYFTFNVLPSDSGAAVGVLITDLTAQKHHEQLSSALEQVRVNEAALRESEQTLRGALEFRDAVARNMGEGLYTVDAEGRVTSMNPAAEELFGFSFEELRGRRMHDMTHHHHRDGRPFPAEECAGLQVLRQGKILTGHEDCFIRKDGTFFDVIFSSSPLKSGDDIIGLVVVFQDVTERKRSEERQRLLMHELEHRGKNLLTVIQAMVSRTLSSTKAFDDVRQALTRRIQSLAHSQNVLMSRGFAGATVSEIVNGEFAAFSDRVESTGPHVMLHPRAAQTLALVVHELATNATKHGALSRPGGQVAVRWWIDGAPGGARFHFKWRERGGPRVAPPTRQGFGRDLLEKAAAHEFASPTMRFAEDGLAYDIDAPAASVLAATR